MSLMMIEQLQNLVKRTMAHSIAVATLTMVIGSVQLLHAQDLKVYPPENLQGEIFTGGYYKGALEFGLTSNRFETDQLNYFYQVSPEDSWVPLSPLASFASNHIHPELETGGTTINFCDSSGCRDAAIWDMYDMLNYFDRSLPNSNGDWLKLWNFTNYRCKVWTTNTGATTKICAPRLVTQAAKFTANGQQIGPSFQVSETSAGGHYSKPRGLLLNNGRMVFSFSELYSGKFIYFFDETGSLISQSNLAPVVGYADFTHNIVELADGSILWTSGAVTSENGWKGAHFKIFNNDGSEKTELTPVTHSIRAKTSDAFEAAIPLSNGNFLFYWINIASDSSNMHQILGQLFNPDGQAVSGILLLDETNNKPAFPSAIALGETGFALSWMEHDGTFPLYDFGNAIWEVYSNLNAPAPISGILARGESDIFLRKYSLQGSALGPKELVNQNETVGTQGYPDLVAGQNGGFFVGWADLTNATYYVLKYPEGRLKKTAIPGRGIARVTFQGLFTKSSGLTWILDIDPAHQGGNR